MKLLLLIRILGFGLAIATIAAPWLVPAALASRLPLARRIALALGLGAQLALTTNDVARGRAPWTKLVFPIVGALVAAEVTFAHALPWWLLALGGAGELAFAVLVSVWAFRTRRSGGDEYPEAILQRAFARFVDEPVARFFALDVTVTAAGFRYLCGGFRRAVPAGFSMTTHSDIPLLLALPIFVILPEMIVVDLLIPASAWLWRVASDALHLYTMLWAIGAYATFRDRPHRLGAASVRFSFGAFRTLVVNRPDIRSAVAQPATFDARAWRRAHRAGGCSLVASGGPVVEIELGVPLRVPGWRGTRDVWHLAVSADRPHELARALAAT